MVRNGRNADRKGVKHPLAKLSAADVERVKMLRGEGHTLRVIGAEFGISEGQVSLISRGESWKHTFENHEQNKEIIADGSAS